MATYKGEEINLKPTATMAEEAQRGLDWRKEHGRGGTEVGVARARQLVNRQELSPDTVRRMVSYFARHEVDKQGEGFSPGEDGYPSAGRIAWALWGGDAGKSWANEKDRIMDRLDDEKRAAPDALSVGDFVSWDSSGGRARGRIEKIERDGKINVPNTDFSITGEEDDPAALIRLYRMGEDDYEATDTLVGHKFSTLTKINDLRGEREIDFSADFDHNAQDATEERGDDMEQRHIIDVQENDDAYVITFAKPHQEMEESGDDKDMEERPYHDDEEERIERADLVHRAMDMDDRAIDEETRTVMVGVSSEEPVKRSFGMEVIDHSRESMNLEFLNSGRAPLLLDHDMERQIGVVESVKLDEEARRLRAKVRFGRGDLSSEVFNDVTDSIRQNISVGYRVDNRVEREGDPEEYYRVATTPMEISIVSIPADQSSLVGVGRSSSEPLHATLEIKGDDKMSDIDLDAVRAEAAKTAQKNAKEIMTLARKHNKADMGEEALGRGASIDEFRGELLEAIGNQPLETPAHVVDVPVKEKREYSLGKMIRAQINHDWKDAGFEREMHDEIAVRTGRQSEGFYIPDFAWRAGAMATAATGAVGDENVVDNFIPTIHRGDMFIEALRSKQVMAALGVTFMGGLTNRIKMPKFSTGASAGFVEELGAVADQSQTDAGVTLQPRTMGAYVDIGRLALKESIPALDQIVQDDLLRALADKLEATAISGSGSSGEPTGILNDGNVGNVDISSGTDVAALTWADLTDLVKTVEDANGVINQATLGWLTNPKVKAKMANTVKVASTDSIMLLNDPWNSIYGYRAEFTGNVPSNLNPGDGGTDASALIFGDFSQLMVGLFGAPSILVDETTGGLAGTVRIIVHQDVDVALRNAASFAITDEVSTA
jgi:HK97 family phage major capsid protein/HK97 family phage prohead protease